MSISDLEQHLSLIDFPGRLKVSVADPGAVHPPLHPVEEAAVLRAVSGRRAEFAAGRVAARMALAQMGLPGVSIPMAEDRAPVWPAGTVGSISHTGSACIAITGDAEDYAGLGIDLEDAGSLDISLRREIGTKKELDQISDDHGVAATRLFSLKEAAYKAQYNLSRTVFGFGALELADGGKCLRFARPVPPFKKGDCLPVLQWNVSDMWLSLCALSASFLHVKS